MTDYRYTDSIKRETVVIVELVRPCYSAATAKWRNRISP